MAVHRLRPIAADYDDATRDLTLIFDRELTAAEMDAQDPAAGPVQPTTEFRITFRVPGAAINAKR